MCTYHNLILLIECHLFHLQTVRGALNSPQLEQRLGVWLCIGRAAQRRQDFLAQFSHALPCF
jgi:hypothetical protein